jgi:hypothetical protein
MASVGHYSADRRTLAQTSGASLYPTDKSDKSATRVDIALLVSALFLQRFTLPFGATFLALDLVAIGFILLYQFLSGKLLIQYDRALWFLGFALAITCSLLLNFNSTMLTAYFLFMVFYSLFALSRPSTPDQYKRTLQAFQFLVMILSCLAMAQFVAQFVVDPIQLVMFFGIVPDFLFDDLHAGGKYAIGAVYGGSSLMRSNGIFLAEPSFLSQITALGILIEILEFRRTRYLLVMALGFLVAFSGTGLVLLLLFLPLAGLRHGKAGLYALLVAMFALGLFATGIMDPSVFLSRVGEFEDTRTSGFTRFVAPFWLAAKQFNTVSVQALLLGSGPGTIKILADTWYAGGFAATWIKILYEYGIIGSFIFVCFLAACLRRSRCPGLVVAAIIFAYVFLQGMMTITIALCTLSGPEPRRRHIDGSSKYQPPLVAGSAAG